MDYLVSPTERPEWRVEAERFEAALDAAYPGTEVRFDDDPESPMALHFEATVGAERVSGDLHRDGSAISLEGDLVALMAAAQIFAGLTPPGAQLVFYDQGYNASIPVDRSATPAELAQRYLDAAWT